MKPPMRVSYERGRWGNLDGGCDCHRPPGPDFQNPGDAREEEILF